MDAPKTKPATPQGGTLLPEAFFLEMRMRKVGTVKPSKPSRGRGSNRLFGGVIEKFTSFTHARRGCHDADGKSPLAR